jgi:hypothetical protein
MLWRNWFFILSARYIGLYSNASDYAVAYESAKLITRLGVSLFYPLSTFNEAVIASALLLFVTAGMSSNCDLSLLD